MGKKTKRVPEEEEGDDGLKPGAVYLSHIPHGFYEKEMKSYFSQFGDVTNIKLVRSKRTGRSRGFAFIEFACSRVAKIVAETHDNYLLFEKLMKCHYVDPATLNPNTFREFRLKKRIEVIKKPKTQGEIQRHVKGVLRREQKRRNRLQSLGIKYNFPGYSSCMESKEYTLKASKHTIFTEDEGDNQLIET